MKRNRPLVIGITGGVGTGKSTVRDMFKRLGAKVLDADKIAHDKMKKGTEICKKITKEFGKGILAHSGGIERRRLAAIVFKDKKALRRLCGIIHPEVIKHVNDYIKAVRKSDIPAVVIDAPLLIEAGMRAMVDVLVVVIASETAQIERSVKKTGLSRDEIKRRMRNQIPLKDKMVLADYIIDNKGSKENTKKIIAKIWKEIKSGRD